MRNVTRFRRFLVQETLQYAKDGQWNEDDVIPCALRVLDAIDQLYEYFEGLEASHGSHKATRKIGTGAPPRMAVHQSADFSPFARDARSSACVGLGMLRCLLRDVCVPHTVLVVTAPARL
jgi:hypothetical protein